MPLDFVLLNVYLSLAILYLCIFSVLLTSFKISLVFLIRSSFSHLENFLRYSNLILLHRLLALFTQVTSLVENHAEFPSVVWTKEYEINAFLLLKLNLTNLSLISCIYRPNTFLLKYIHFSPPTFTTIHFLNQYP